MCLCSFKSWSKSSKRHKSFRIYIWVGSTEDKQVIGTLQLFIIEHSAQFRFPDFTISQYKCIFNLCSGSFHYLQSSICDTTYTCNWKWYQVMSNFYGIVHFTKSFHIYCLILSCTNTATKEKVGIIIILISTESPEPSKVQGIKRAYNKSLLEESKLRGA